MLNYDKYDKLINKLQSDYMSDSRTMFWKNYKKLVCCNHHSWPKTLTARVRGLKMTHKNGFNFRHLWLHFLVPKQWEVGLPCIIVQCVLLIWLVLNLNGEQEVGWIRRNSPDLTSPVRFPQWSHSSLAFFFVFEFDLFGN